MTKKPNIKITGALKAYATGRRKTAVSKVWMYEGKGNIWVNRKLYNEYFFDASHQIIVNQPLQATKTNKSYDIFVMSMGGGLSGQAEAVRHGISRALVLSNELLRSELRKSGFLTRDSRKVERKKYGHQKARRSFQFSKR